MIDRWDLMIANHSQRTFFLIQCNLWVFSNLRYNTMKNRKVIILKQSKDTLRMNGYLDCDVVLLPIFPRTCAGWIEIPSCWSTMHDTYLDCISVYVSLLYFMLDLHLSRFFIKFMSKHREGICLLCVSKIELGKSPKKYFFRPGH